MIISLIVAIAQNGVIGKSSGEMSWHVSEEFKHFKNTTKGFPVLMGRKTFETLGKPLKERLNIVLTRNPEYKTQFDDVLIFSSLDEAINFCREKKFEKIFIIGGAEIYKIAIPIVDEMIISRMKFTAEGDVYFPEFDESNWKKEKIMDKELFEVYLYKRI
ncbi:Dihydrofolate reductase [Ignavibacterium album JCM 16511]|uniref:Dihydrofolate reductase n=1 Tax=Ignavibacterium album (strain DSM 19864 / JCM 16511 / NBRC 101810 / Mat9-16) TaxID=945713 RepID=I0ALG2_IGNAJ|nr:dihydrofolate reductase [Ignavibacterium album]AFH49819.1 Dihydrofolate reductase [Ignavibacterium album JCM 16511]